MSTRQDLSAPPLNAGRRSTTSTPKEPPSGGRRRTGRPIRFLFILLTAIALILIVGLAVYDRAYTVRSTFATITAPSVTLRAPGSGLLRVRDVAPGSEVKREAMLAVVQDQTHETDLALALSRIEAGEELLNAMEQRHDALIGAPAGGGELVSAPPLPGAGRRDGVFEDLARLAELDPRDSSGIIQTGNPQVDGSDIETLRQDIRQTGVFLEQARAQAAAYEQAIAANTVFSPCECFVYWLRGTHGGEWVEEGDPLFTLASTDPGEMLVEARVPIADTRRIEKHQRAWVHLPEDRGTAEGRVVAIRLEGEPAPRAGFPDWVRQQLSQASVLVTVEQEMDREMIGQPLDVRFPASGGLASLMPGWLRDWSLGGPLGQPSWPEADADALAAPAR